MGGGGEMCSMSPGAERHEMSSVSLRRRLSPLTLAFLRRNKGELAEVVEE